MEFTKIHIGQQYGVVTSYRAQAHNHNHISANISRITKAKIINKVKANKPYNGKILHRYKSQILVELDSSGHQIWLESKQIIDRWSNCEIEFAALELAKKKQEYSNSKWMNIRQWIDSISKEIGVSISSTGYNLQVYIPIGDFEIIAQKLGFDVCEYPDFDEWLEHQG